MPKNAAIPLALVLVLSCAIPAQPQIRTQHQARDRAAPAPMPDRDEVSLPAFEKKWAAMLAQNAQHQFVTNVNAGLLTAMAQAVACDDIVGVVPTGVASNAADARLLDGATLFARCGNGDFIVITARSTISQPGLTVSTDAAAYALTIAGLPARKMYYKSAQGRERTVLAMLAADTAYSVTSWSTGDASQPHMTTAPHIDQAALVLAQQRSTAPAGG